MRKIFSCLAVVAVVVVLSGVPALAGVGTQEQPINQDIIRPVATSQQLEGVGGAFERFWSLLVNLIESLKTRPAPVEMANSPIVPRGVGTQE